MAKLNGPALSAIAVGTILAWSGIKGWSVLGTVQDIITGHPPTGEKNRLIGKVLGRREDTGFVPKGTGDVAGEALKHIGHPYRFGGAPGLNAQNPWDCSSFVNWVVGTKLGRAIPGYAPGVYNGSVHGPPTGTWGIWYAGLTSVRREQVVAGDIIVWTQHMGIAINNQQMVNAINPNEGTKVTPIDGHGNGPLMIYGRLKG